MLDLSRQLWTQAKPTCSVPRVQLLSHNLWLHSMHRDLIVMQNDMIWGISFQSDNPKTPINFVTD